MKEKITINIDMKPINKKIEKYIIKKIQEQIRQEIEYDTFFDFPEIKFPEIEKRIEKLEEWKEDIKKGFIKITETGEKTMFEPSDIIDFIFEETKIIMEAMTDDDHLTMINHADLLFKLVGEEFLKEHELIKIKERINTTLNNEKNIRVLKLMQKIKKEIDTSVEYYDKDIGQDERLFYQLELEEEMTEFSEEIRKALAIIIKERTGGGLDIE